MLTVHPGNGHEEFESEGCKRPYLVDSDMTAAWGVEIMIDVGVFNRRL